MGFKKSFFAVQHFWVKVGNLSFYHNRSMLNLVIPVQKPNYVFAFLPSNLHKQYGSKINIFRHFL